MDDDVSNQQSWYEDLDGDGFGMGVAQLSCEMPSAGMVNDNLDCDDTNGEVYPSGPEACNGIDDDCDGVTDGLVAYVDASGVSLFFS